MSSSDDDCSSSSSLHEPPAKVARKTKSQESVHYGERQCENKSKPCEHRAYWKQGHRYLCGVHAKDESRKPLPKRPAKEKKAIKLTEKMRHDTSVSHAQQDNAARGQRGAVTLQRMRQRHKTEQAEGVLNVFPNFKHKTRSDGRGCATLSPMALGPVEHGQPGLKPAKNIENFHQGSKCFREETIPGTDDPGPLYYENRARFYEDSVPHRHKYKGTGKNKNIPLYFIWVDRRDGKEYCLNYIESRQFYCTFYERLVREQAEYKQLEADVADGMNICICGYDGTPLDADETVEHAYLDDTKPFGHERVLYAMLTTPDPEQLPWRRHKTFDF
jgi:hypothetical protein